MLSSEISRYLGVFAYPFVSLDFLKQDLLEQYFISRTDGHEKKKSLEIRTKLRNCFETYVRNKYGINTLDEIYLILDKWYLYPRPASCNGEQKYERCSSYDLIFEHLYKFSQSLISQYDGKIIYKYWENENDYKILGGFRGPNKIYLFHSMQRMFSMDILSILYLVKQGKSISELAGNFGQIKVSDMLLDTVLEKGVAENHLHKGVSPSFLSAWEDYMLPITEANYKTFVTINKMHKQPHDLYYISLAGMLRYLCIIFPDETEPLDGRRCNSCNAKKQLQEMLNILRNSKIEELYTHLISEEYDLTLEHWIVSFWNEVSKSVSLQKMLEKGVMRTVCPDFSSITTSDENLFLYHTLHKIERLSYINKQDNKLQSIKLLFLNYLRIKNYFYNTIVQEKTVHGLNYFQNYYRSNADFHKAALKIKNTCFWERAIREQLQNQNLHKAEFRMSFAEKMEWNKNNILDFLTAYRNILQSDYCGKTRSEDGDTQYIPIRIFPRVAIICHLLKQEQEYDSELCAYSENENHSRQYIRLHDTYLKQVNCIKQLRSTLDSSGKLLGLDKYIVGLDVASLENAVPTWVFNDVYDQARDSREEPLLCNQTQAFQSLGFTIHAGEDFRHVLSGLRRIYEAVKGLKFHAGDRIGHGIALGISLEAWFRSNPTIVIPRIEALENYLWAYSILCSGESKSPTINLLYLEQEAIKLAQEIYGEQRTLTLSLLVRAYEKLYSSKDSNKKWEQINACDICDENGVCKLHNSEQKEIFTWGLHELMLSIHCKYYVYKMNEPIHRKMTEQDKCIAAEMQRFVREYINEKGIIVEVNPSSNVAIADIDTLADNQVYSINPAQYDFQNVMTCINSDDPSVFNTNVTNELGYIYFGMIERGINRESVLQWIEKLRETGMRASFIRNIVPDNHLLQELDMIIEQF